MLGASDWCPRRETLSVSILAYVMLRRPQANIILYVHVYCLKLLNKIEESSGTLFMGLITQ